MARTKSAEAAVQEKSGTEVISSTEAKENGAAGGNEAKKGENTSTYTVDEFVKAADSVFGKHYSPDIIRAAMKVAGKKVATKEEAKKIISEFAEKEVK